MYGWTSDLHKIGGYFAISVITVGKLDVVRCSAVVCKTVKFGRVLYESCSLNFTILSKWKPLVLLLLLLTSGTRNRLINANQPVLISGSKFMTQSCEPFDRSL